MFSAPESIASYLPGPCGPQEGMELVSVSEEETEVVKAVAEMWKVLG